MVCFRPIFLAVCLLLTPVAGLAQKTVKESIVSGGKKRNYFLYVPASVEQATAIPLLVVLHGSGRNGQTVVEKWKALAEQERIIIVGPDSLDPSNWSIPNDGPAFIHELVESMKTKFPIDPRRIYLFGHSGGAGFALLMSFYESEYFAATAIHAGALNSATSKLPDLAKRKIPIHIQVGSRDPLFPVVDVRATRDLLKARQFNVELVEIPLHDHWYYDLAPRINETAWRFLNVHKLESAPRFEEHLFKSEKSSSAKATEHYNRGVQQHQEGNLAAAIVSYTRAIELDKSSADVYFNRGAAYLSQKDLANAIADFNSAIELSPSDAAFNNRAYIYMSQQKFNEAITDITAALRLKESADAYANRGLAYEHIDQQGLALADYERAIELNPKFGRAYVLRGLILLSKGQDEPAQKDFEQAFKLDPGLHAEFDGLIRQNKSNRKAN